jgi:hypothetical protein
MISLVAFGGLHWWTRGTEPEVKTCSKELVMLLQGFIFYFLFVFVRQMICLTLILWVKNPVQMRDRAFFVYLLADIFLVITLTTWGSTIVFST